MQRPNDECNSFRDAGDPEPLRCDERGRTSFHARYLRRGWIRWCQCKAPQHGLQFDVVNVGQGKASMYLTAPFAYKLPDFKRAVRATQDFLAIPTAGQHPLWKTMINHAVRQKCCPRHHSIKSLTTTPGVSTFGDGRPQWRERSAKMLATLFGSLYGTLFVYQG